MSGKPKSAICQKRNPPKVVQLLFVSSVRPSPFLKAYILGIYYVVFTSL